jgi:hypothetical protein
MTKNETIRCETVDDGARNVIKSDDCRLASDFRWLPRRFALKGKDFS